MKINCLWNEQNEVILQWTCQSLNFYMQIRTHNLVIRSLTLWPLGHAPFPPFTLPKISNCNKGLCNGITRASIHTFRFTRTSNRVARVTICDIHTEHPKSTILSVVVLLKLPRTLLPSLDSSISFSGHHILTVNNTFKTFITTCYLF